MLEGYRLAGKTALVTGVEHTIGRAAAATLAEAGADVAVLAGQAGSTFQAHAEDAAAVVRQQQRQSRAYAVDVREQAAVRRVVTELLAAWGHVDILINGLDKPFAMPFVDQTTQAWDSVLQHILYGTIHCIQAVGQHMVARRQGRIITYISTLAERGVAHCAVYSAAQAAILQLTRTLAVEWGKQGVTVNAIGSGWMQDSPLLPAAEEERERLLRYIPNHRFGHPGDLTTLTVYLVSDLGGNVTGQVMYIEGGVMAHP